MLLACGEDQNSNGVDLLEDGILVPISTRAHHSKRGTLLFLCGGTVADLLGCPQHFCLMNGLAHY